MEPWRSSRKGAFTLIELLVVISIIALLSSVVLASVTSARDRARVAAGQQFASQTGRVAGDSAVGIWDFEEGTGTLAADRSGFGHHGTLEGGPAWSTDTPSSGGSVRFDGSNDRVTVSITDGLKPTEAITVSAWIKPSSTSGVRNILGNAEMGGYYLALHGSSDGSCNAGLYCFQVFVDGGWKAVSAPLSLIRIGEWQHVLGMWDGSHMRLYLNGAQVGSRSLSGTMTHHATAPFCIGAEPGTTSCSTAWFSGTIDDVRVYTKGLTASEVGAVYAEGAHRLRYAYED